jgi:hypothetical protein
MNNMTWKHTYEAEYEDLKMKTTGYKKKAEARGQN